MVFFHSWRLAVLARIILAVLLVTAAGAKLLAPYHSGLAIPVYLYYSMCVLEVALGIGLFSRLATMCGWIAILLFVVGGVFAMFMEKPCGCMGVLAAGPRIQLMIDGLGGLLAVGVILGQSRIHEGGRSSVNPV